MGLLLKLKKRLLFYFGTNENRVFFNGVEQEWRRNIRGGHPVGKTKFGGQSGLPFCLVILEINFLGYYLVNSPV